MKRFSKSKTKMQFVRDLAATMCMVILLTMVIGCAPQGNEPSHDHTPGTTAPSMSTTPTGPSESEPPAPTDGTEPSGSAPSEPAETEPPGTEPAPTDPSPTIPENTDVPTTPTEPPHTHDYKATETVDATCEDEGYTLYVCDCGDSYQEDTKKLGHDYKAKEKVEPGCMTEGYTVYKCARCGHSYKKAKEALGHDNKTEVVAPTYEAQGYTLYTCKRCGNTRKGNYTDKLERPVDPDHVHDFQVERIIAPTCKNDGCTLYRCSCGQSYVAARVSALGHNMLAEAHAPTEKAPGYTTYTCSHCGLSYNDNFVAQVGASDNVAENLKNAKGAVPMMRGYDAKLDASADYSTYVGPTNLANGISWNGKPIVYTYPNGTTGAVCIVGAYYEENPGFVNQVSITLDNNSAGYPRIDKQTYCERCGKPSGDGTKGTCLHWWKGTHTCPLCNATVPANTCHTCPESNV